MTTVSKKRTVGEITKPDGGSSSKKTAMASESDSSTLWIEKHAPKTIEELVINKKKVKEFIEVVEENGGGGFLVL